MKSPQSRVIDLLSIGSFKNKGRGIAGESKVHGFYLL
jgi:hypothetical protein